MTITNRWSSPCHLCGHLVVEGEGVAEFDGDAWLVRHADQGCDDPATAPREGQMANRYPGACERCGGQVEAGAGIVYPDEGRWVLQHPDC